MFINCYKQAGFLLEVTRKLLFDFYITCFGYLVLIITFLCYPVMHVMTWFHDVNLLCFLTLVLDTFKLLWLRGIGMRCHL